MDAHDGLNIRLELSADHKAIMLLTYKAFLEIDYPGRRRIDEHYLVHLLQGSANVIPGLCFVAERDFEIVGHILYTKSKIKRPNGVEATAATFGPLSVLPKAQRQGIGAALVRHSLGEAMEMGFGAVLITGWPKYYPKLGFKRASEYGLCLPDGSAADWFMAYELMPGYLGGGGAFHLAPEYDSAERDNEGFEAFNKQFMAKHFPQVSAPASTVL